VHAQCCTACFKVDEPCTVVFIKVLYSYNCGHGILAVIFMSIKKKWV
jgi:hypothetical protein